MPHLAAPVSIALVAILAGCAGSSAQSLRPPPPINKEGACSEFIVERARPSGSGSSGDYGWVLIAYDLDGSGHARNVHIVDSQNGDEFGKQSVHQYERSTFKAGVTRQECRDLLEFRRRRE